eukprot:TRINITY_DN14161_c0_g1_i1.p1 TRINITY_DN14161_c0_g1~~TRINITY_DN14161_c0_g1_i1.p1  ORF type:complete len:459 (+),score=109.57 TRINITY_DN14161_c0_g1_i1:87-1379(+)
MAHEESPSTAIIEDKSQDRGLRSKFEEARMKKKQQQMRKAQLMIPKAVSALSPRPKHQEAANDIQEGNTAQKLALLEDAIKRRKTEREELSPPKNSVDTLPPDFMEEDDPLANSTTSNWSSIQVGSTEVKLNSEQAREFEQYKEEWESSLKSLPPSEVSPQKEAAQPKEVKKERPRFKRPVLSPNSRLNNVAASPGIELCLTSAQRKEDDDVGEETKRLMAAVEAIERENDLEASCSGRGSIITTPTLGSDIVSPHSDLEQIGQRHSKGSSSLFQTPLPPTPLEPQRVDPHPLPAVPPPQDNMLRVIPEPEAIPVRNIKNEIDALVERNASLPTEEIDSIRLRIESTTNPLSMEEVDNILSRLDSEDKKIVHLVSTLSNKRLAIERARDQLIKYQRSKEASVPKETVVSTSKPEVPSPSLVSWVAGWFKK